MSISSDFFCTSCQHSLLCRSPVLTIVEVSVRVSVTLCECVKTTQIRITFISEKDSSLFLEQKIFVIALHFFEQGLIRFRFVFE